MADAPFGDTEQASYHYQVREAQVPVPGAIMVPLDAIERDPAQPRRDWRHDDGYERLAELTRSIQEFGILQPLVVRRAGDHYVVIAGGRRLVAAKRAGLSHVPVIVRDEEGARVRVLQLVENVQRQQLTPLDEARAYQELMEIEGLTIGEIAARIHVSTQTVRDKLRLLRDQVLGALVGQLADLARGGSGDLPSFDGVGEHLIAQEAQFVAHGLCRDVDSCRYLSYRQPLDLHEFLIGARLI